jgi:putative endonuclease
MPCWVYILQSETTGRFYCGQTTDLARRLHQHNDPAHRTTKTTKRLPGPWTLVWSQGCTSRSEAMTLERAIKRRGIARHLATARGRAASGC